MDELTKYVITSYFDLMTFKEKAAYKASFSKEKAENLEPGIVQRSRREKCGSADPEVLALLHDGREEFLKNVRNRILRDHAGSVFLNYGPKCGWLTKTPRAKQCPKCFFSWHDDPNDSGVKCVNE